MTLWRFRCNFKRCVIMYKVKNRQSVKGEALSAPPQKRKGVRKGNQKGRWWPHFSHHCSGISLLHCDKQALLQVGERLGFPDDPFETAIQFLKNEKVSGSKGPSVSMATSVKLWHWLRAVYLSCLLRSARAAPTPASLVALGRWGGRVLILCMFPQTLKWSTMCKCAFSILVEKPDDGIPDASLMDYIVEYRSGLWVYWWKFCVNIMKCIYSLVRWMLIR